MSNRSAYSKATYEKFDPRMDALLAESPPEIVWVRRGLVLVAAEIHDQHTEARTWDMGRHTRIGEVA